MCGASVLHSKFWPLLDKSPGQCAALQPRGRYLHQHQPVWTGQSGAAGQGSSQNGAWHCIQGMRGDVFGVISLCTFFFSKQLSVEVDYFYVCFQAEEEARRNRLMRDMAQLRLQVNIILTDWQSVFPDKCWSSLQRNYTLLPSKWYFQLDFYCYEE